MVHTLPRHPWDALQSKNIEINQDLNLAHAATVGKMAEERDMNLSYKEEYLQTCRDLFDEIRDLNDELRDQERQLIVTSVTGSDTNV